MNPSIPDPKTYRLRRDPDPYRVWESVKPSHDANGFDPNQPRVPAGDPDGGQWTGDGGGQRPIAQPIFAPAVGAGAAAAVLLASRTAFARRKAIDAALILFTWLSAQNRSDKQAIFVFKAREFRPNESGELELDEVKLLDRDEVDAACPRFGEVRARTELAVRRTRRDLPPAEFGTEVHTDLKRQIDKLNDPRFLAEVSYLKTKQEIPSVEIKEEVSSAEMKQKVEYGTAGSIRIDVLEKVGDRTVCVYDIKTGQRGLSLPRTYDIATTVLKEYPNTQRIIVTEVRPRRDNHR